MRRIRKGSAWRIALWAGEKECEVCGADLVGRMTWTRFCDPCRTERTRVQVPEKAKARYRERKDRGICVRCGKVPATHGLLCEPHREREREKSFIYRQRDRRRNRVLGSCVECGILIDQIYQTKYCSSCRDRMREIWRRRAYCKKKDRGICVECGKVPARPERASCEECGRKAVAKRNQEIALLKDQGLCVNCGEPRGRTLQCDDCRLAKKKRRWMKT